MLTTVHFMDLSYGFGEVGVLFGAWVAEFGRFAVLFGTRVAGFGAFAG
ncbi:hypothetical protein [Sporosarcina cyprini]|nr:hypothetical protein [Sporosarcina cyprini]MCG3086563.1 hypothetical protein [Sporosarcina cyprini]